MRFKFHSLLPGILLAVSPMAFADPNYSAAGANLSEQTQSLANLSTYLTNLGKYFGYDVTQYCTSDGQCPTSNSGSNSSSSYSSVLLDTNYTQSSELYLFSTYLGSLFGGGSSGTTNYNPLVPSSGSLVNSAGNKTFTNPAYSSPSADTVSVLDLMDQKSFQSDPVSQAVLNMLSTPDFTYCTYYINSSNASSANNSCPLLFREKVMAGVIPQLPHAQDVFSSAYNQPIVSQLNSNVFFEPLLYSTTSDNNSNSSSNSSTDSGSILNSSLPSSTQAQQAANFIRYATGAVNPITLPNQKAYDSLVSIAENYQKLTNMTPAQLQTQLQAKIALSNYLTRLRTYTAQTSVGISNLYYLLSRRLPQQPQNQSQDQGSAQSQPTSEALNEFNMASWRLFNSNTNSNTQAQWLNKIDKASAATVQKEMAVLLAEINYQLYLSRQQNERMLLTQSILLLQNAQSTRPNGNIAQSSAKKISEASASGN